MIEDIEFASFADDTTPYSTKDCIDDVISSLTKASEDIFKWFSDNEMKVNPEKCKLIVAKLVFFLFFFFSVIKFTKCVLLLYRRPIFRKKLITTFGYCC